MLCGLAVLKRISRTAAGSTGNVSTAISPSNQPLGNVAGILQIVSGGRTRVEMSVAERNFSTNPPFSSAFNFGNNNDAGGMQRLPGRGGHCFSVAPWRGGLWVAPRRSPARPAVERYGIRLCTRCREANTQILWETHRRILSGLNAAASTKRNEAWVGTILHTLVAVR